MRRRLVLIVVCITGLVGCAISFGGGRETRMMESGITIQDGQRWSCVVLKEAYEPTIWRQVRKGVCYEVQP